MPIRLHKSDKIRFLEDDKVVVKKKKTKKKTKKKKVVGPPPVPEGEVRTFGVSEPRTPTTIETTDIESLEKAPKFVKIPLRGSIYDDITDKMSELQAGQYFLVKIPEGVTAKTMHNRISAALQRLSDIGTPVEPPEGCRIIKRTTRDETCVAICCIHDLREDYEDDED